MSWLTAIEMLWALAAGGLVLARFGGGAVALAAAPHVRRPVNRRFWACIAIAALLHVLLISPSLWELFRSKLHERPLGIPGGSGNRIAKGTPDATGGSASGAQQKEAIIKARTVQVSARKRPDRGKSLYMQRVTRDGLLALLKSREGGEVEIGRDAELSGMLDSVGDSGGGDGGPPGLDEGEGGGATAAGSPYGTKRGKGGALWLYRIKYEGGDWAANPPPCRRCFAK